jgi:hypothetical protein
MAMPNAPPLDRATNSVENVLAQGPLKNIWLFLRKERNA